MSLIFPPGSFFAARRSFLPRSSTFKIAAGAFAAGAVLATVASNAPRGSSPTVTAENAATVEIKSAGEKAKPGKRLEIAAKPKIVAPESRDVSHAAPATVPLGAAPVAVSDMTAVAKPAEIDDNIGLIARQAVPSPRPKPEALIAMAATPATATYDEPKVWASRAKPDALASLIARLNAADAAGAPAPETAELSSFEAPAEAVAETLQPAPEVTSAAAKPVEAKPAEVKPAAPKRAASTRARRYDNREVAASRPLNLAEVRALHPMGSSLQARNRANGFTLVRSRTLPDGRRVTVWQRPAEPAARSSSPMLAFGSLFR